MEDEEVGEGVGEEEGQAEEEEEAVGEGRDGGAGGRDGEEGRDAGCFFFAYKSVIAGSHRHLRLMTRRRMGRGCWGACTSVPVLAVLLHVEHS